LDKHTFLAKVYGKINFIGAVSQAAQTSVLVAIASNLLDNSLAKIRIITTQSDSARLQTRMDSKGLQAMLRAMRTRSLHRMFIRFAQEEM
jgi:hypothetical protein